ncbi:MAG: hypothetical protein AMR96_05010 [Candidatus Adiutrix intracellularis]|nr:MAG: hypothetical protein AMR96_05010 [Candidatus Adiutrix intracellularis]
MNKKAIWILIVLLTATVILASFIGRYSMTVNELLEVGRGWLTGRELSPREDQFLFLFFQVRMPRIVTAILVGASLSVSGTIYQNMFLNPLVSPGVLGVLAGASCGAAVGIVIFSSWPLTQIFSFAGGILGVSLSIFFSKLYPKAPILALLVGGLVSASFFTAITSLLKYVADPNQQLPQLIFWLMGTLSRAENEKLSWIGPPLALGLIFLVLNGKVLNILSQGDEEARALGIESARMRLIFISTATLICSLSVILSGIINWVGLVIPHILRLILGPNNQTLLPASALGGGLFLLITDTIVRSVWTVEFPLSIFTALICLPIFSFSLWYDWKRP